ncbi:YjbE family putative metal transport protein [Heliobacterium gestii]|uniref:YjbE family putative metal transport protein n=1 Tax=Heliomicrobium gestii TaxID=2699 RepID=A0A845LBC4_HELGE|nr:TerC family protein [Heliomicrobium gestii]MBM7865565.1 YjbE family integral membrane protein [Heliomicrobium gestii]MZP41815.1 YjbE family putative metal transport protein [Heliomicrobium gestii]
MLEFLGSISGIKWSDFAEPAFWLAIGSIILIDLILSGDNAILIAMACRNLPRELRTRGIIWGTLGAIALRMVLGAVIIYLLQVPLLQAAGGLLLVWIALKLLIQEDDHNHVDAPNRLWQAVKTIVMADAVMSLDNVVAVAGVSHGKPGLLWFGLLVSIPLVVYGSRLFLALLDRYTIILYGGAGILGWTAGKMLIHDPLLLSSLQTLGMPPLLLNESAVGAAVTAIVLITGWFINDRKKRKPAGREAQIL